VNHELFFLSASDDMSMLMLIDCLSAKPGVCLMSS